MLQLTYPVSWRRNVALLAVLASVGCGGGGAVLPTDVDTGTGGEPAGPSDGGSVGGATPVTVTITIDDEGGFSPASTTIPVGSTVVWQVLDNHHDVTFVGAAPAGGSIEEIDEDESASRTFTEPGTYGYFCERHDDDAERGVIVVQAGDGGGDDGGGGEPQEPGTSATVRTVGDSFSPASVTIAAGGTVQWQISGDEHNVTFTGAAPPEGNIPNTEGATVSRSFPSAGRYDYFCTRHSGMTGAVTVE